MTGSTARARLVVLALGAILAGAGPGDEATRTKGKGTVAGRLIDLEGRPVAGAEVWAGDRNQVATRARTGADGRFRLGPLSDERAVTIWAEHEERGLAREHFEDVRIFAGRETDLGDVALVPGARLLGRVVDGRGRPVAEARATVLSRRHILGYTVTPNGPKWAVRGDDRGRFRTPALPVGKLELTVTAPGRARQYLDPLVEPGKTAIDLGEIRLEDERPVTGVVVDQDGRPVAGARVVVDADDEHAATTDDTGRFAVRGAAIDAGWMYIEAPGYFDPALNPYHELKGRRADLRMVLQKAFTVEGSVVDADTDAPVEIDHVQLCTVERDEDNKITLAG
jgi:hypothetical protein